MIAIPPFTKMPNGFVKDATGSIVVTCSELEVCTLYSENEIEKDGHFICPKCGRLGQRMVEFSWNK
jgi:hypothetical protein